MVIFNLLISYFIFFKKFGIFENIMLNIGFSVVGYLFKVFFNGLFISCKRKKKKLELFSGKLDNIFIELLKLTFMMGEEIW